MFLNVEHVAYNTEHLQAARYSCLQPRQNTYIVCRNVLCHSYFWTFHIFSTYSQKLLLLGCGNQLKVSIFVPIPAPITTTDKDCKTTTTTTTTTKASQVFISIIQALPTRGICMLQAMIPRQDIKVITTSMAVLKKQNNQGMVTVDCIIQFYKQLAVAVIFYESQ